ncbi:MAG: peptide deformylase [Phycisphaerales bacterium]
MPPDPASLIIVHHPEPVLRQRAKPVDAVTDHVRAVARRMIELMAQAEGIGLAAPQVGLSWRLFVCHVPANEERALGVEPQQATPAPQVYINPVLSDMSRDLVSYEEGCLSLPEIKGDVRRPSEITITALDLNGQRFTHRATGLLARCWQHEVDHLDGVLIIDKMSQVHRMRNRLAIRALEKAGPQTPGRVTNPASAGAR